MTSVVATLAFLIGVAGLIETSQATLGVGLIGFACLLGILVRISQANEHHKKIVGAPPPRVQTRSAQALD